MNGKPLSFGMVRFQPVEDALTPQKLPTAFAMVQQGRYNIPATRGVSPGQHRVEVYDLGTFGPVPHRDRARRYSAKSVIVSNKDVPQPITILIAVESKSDTDLPAFDERWTISLRGFTGHGGDSSQFKTTISAAGLIHHSTKQGNAPWVDYHVVATPLQVRALYDTAVRVFDEDDPLTHEGTWDDGFRGSIGLWSADRGASIDYRNQDPHIGLFAPALARLRALVERTVAGK